MAGVVYGKKTKWKKQNIHAWLKVRYKKRGRIYTILGKGRST